MQTMWHPPALALAPMAGVTDLAFRETCLMSADIYTVTEMVSAKALCHKDAKTARLLALGKTETCAAAQLFGSDPGCMAEAAQIALEISPALAAIDVNMGCPTPKIIGPGDGAALMKTPELAARIVEKMTKAAGRPITVKMRLGWDKGSINAVRFAMEMEAAGAAAVCVHGRTRAQMYSGRADWDAIAEVKAALKIPVIANGDIDSPESALRCKRLTGADMLMVGRASFGNPWLLAQITDALAGRPPAAPPPLAKRLETALGQFRRAAEFKGERVACLDSRKHLAWYLHGLPHSAQWKSAAVRVETLAGIEELITKIVRYYSE